MSLYGFGLGRSGINARQPGPIVGGSWRRGCVGRGCPGLVFLSGNRITHRPGRDVSGIRRDMDVASTGAVGHRRSALLSSISQHVSRKSQDMQPKTRGRASSFVLGTASLGCRTRLGLNPVRPEERIQRCNRPFEVPDALSPDVQSYFCWTATIHRRARQRRSRARRSSKRGRLVDASEGYVVDSIERRMETELRRIPFYPAHSRASERWIPILVPSLLARSGALRQTLTRAASEAELLLAFPPALGRATPVSHSINGPNYKGRLRREWCEVSSLTQASARALRSSFNAWGL